MAISNSQSVLIRVEEEPKPSKDGVVGQEALGELQRETLNIAQDRDPATVPFPPPTPGDKSLLADTPEMVFLFGLTLLSHSLHPLLRSDP